MERAYGIAAGWHGGLDHHGLGHVALGFRRRGIPALTADPRRRDEHFEDAFPGRPRDITRSGRRMIICGPLDPIVQQVFEITGLDDVFAIHDRVRQQAGRRASELFSA
jgi:hypothetical protein